MSIHKLVFTHDTVIPAPQRLPGANHPGLDPGWDPENSVTALSPPLGETTTIQFLVQRVLQLGQDIRAARLRRRISTTIMAERASVSRTTLNKVEKGDSGVSLGIYATVRFVRGLADRIGGLADIRTDTVGLEPEEENLPQRIRRSNKAKPAALVRKGSG